MCPLAWLTWDAQLGLTDGSFPYSGTRLPCFLVWRQISVLHIAIVWIGFNRVSQRAICWGLYHGSVEVMESSEVGGGWGSEGFGGINALLWNSCL